MIFKIWDSIKAVKNAISGIIIGAILIVIGLLTLTVSPWYISAGAIIAGVLLMIFAVFSGLRKIRKNLAD